MSADLPADLAAEVLAGRSSPGLFELGAAAGSAFARGLIQVAGRDAPRWLDGMITNDITKLAHGGARFRVAYARAPGDVEPHFASHGDSTR